jgi:hypothetical protein
MKKVRALTHRERRLLQALAQGSTYAEAARYAGYSEKHLKQSGFQAFQVIKAKMPQILDRKGLTDDAVIDKYLLPALEAKETVFAKIRGKICDKREVIAWGPRLAALELLFKLKCSNAEGQKDSSPTVEVLPDEYIKAINRAIGVTGEFIPLDNRPEHMKKPSAGSGTSGVVALLPEPGSGSREDNGSKGDLDTEDQLPILP